MAITRGPQVAAATRRAAIAALLAAQMARPRLPALAADAADRYKADVVYALPNGKKVELTVRRFTGLGDPAWSYPKREIGSRLYTSFPPAWPYTSPSDFRRLDEEVDTSFYRQPKLVYHIDEASVCALTRYYASEIPAGSDVLDICSSWVSHYPEDFPARMKSLVGTGISAAEL